MENIHVCVEPLPHMRRKSGCDISRRIVRKHVTVLSPPLPQAQLHRLCSGPPGPRIGQRQTREV